MMQPGLKSLFEGFNHEADSFSGQFGLATQRLDANEPILYHAGDVFPTASVIKLVVLAEYLAQVSTGELFPDQEIVIRAEDRVGGSGVIKDLGPGLRFRLADLATLAITVSDNIAANLLINRVGGLERINTRLQALGLRQTNIGRPFVFNSPGNNTGTPAARQTAAISSIGCSVPTSLLANITQTRDVSSRSRSSTRPRGRSRSCGCRSPCRRSRGCRGW